MHGNGFFITRPLISIRECDDLAAALATLPRSRAGARPLTCDATVAALARDQRLIQLAKDWLCGDALPFRPTLFAKSGGANWLIPWHQDTALPLAERFEAADWVLGP